MRVRLNQKGLTLIELMVATTIMLIVFFSLTQLGLTMKKQINGSVSRRTEHLIINNITESVRNNPTLYQVNFDTNDGELERFLAVDKLPWAWNDDNIFPAEECAHCAGRFGYIVRPLLYSFGTRGLYSVIVRIQRSPNDVYDLEFLVGTR